MRRIAMKSVSYLPEEEFRFKRNRKYEWIKKDDIVEGDDFRMTMTLFDFDGEYTCWIGMDMGRCDKGFFEVMEEEIRKVTDQIAPGHLFVNGTHTHSGPVFAKYEDMGPECDSKDGMDHLAWMCGKKAAELYLEVEQELQPFEAQIRTVNIEGCYSNRNSLDGPCDKNAVLIRYIHVQSRETIGLWFSMNCHSTVMFPQNEHLCSDLVGFVSKNLARHYHAPVMPNCGAQGDTSTRLTRRLTGKQGENLSELKRISDDVTSQILKAGNAFEPIMIDRFRTKQFSVGFEYEINPDVLDKTIDRVEKEFAEATESGDRELIRVRRTELNALKQKKNGPTHYKATIPCTAINMGELKWAAFSGELVASLGLKIVRHQPHDHRMVVCYINDRGCGYLVEKSEYGRNFESIASIIPVGVPEVLTDMAIRELDQFDLENGVET